MDRAERIESFRFLLQSPLWTDLLCPLIQEQLDKASRSLLTQDMKGKAEAKLKGRIITLNWLLTLPEFELKEYEREKQEEAAATKVDAEAAFYAEHGRRSPYLPPRGEDQQSS